MSKSREIIKKEITLSLNKSGLLNSLDKYSYVFLCNYKLKTEENKNKYSSKISSEDIENIIYYINKTTPHSKSILIYQDKSEGIPTLPDCKNSKLGIILNDKTSFVLYQDAVSYDLNYIRFVTFNCDLDVFDTLRDIIKSKLSFDRTVECNITSCKKDINKPSQTII